MGVNGDDAHNCSFTLSITTYSCPLNCSGRGTCQHMGNGTRTCLCDKARPCLGCVRCHAQHGENVCLWL